MDGGDTEHAQGSPSYDPQTRSDDGPFLDRFEQGPRLFVRFLMATLGLVGRLGDAGRDPGSAVGRQPRQLVA
jgi:hypothetical protein